MANNLKICITAFLRLPLLQTVGSCLVLSSLIFLGPSSAQAHELRPSVADIAIEADRIAIEIDLNLEALLAGIDLSQHDDTTESAETDRYDQLRATTPEGLSELLKETWPEIAAGMTLAADQSDLSPELTGTRIPPVGDTDLPRDSRITLGSALPPGTASVTIGWQPAYGPLVLRVTGVEDGYTTYLTDGALSDPIPVSGVETKSGWAVFLDYVVIGFEHILPKGLDHILFVLGLFFLSLRLRPLIWQISAFTVAHTITLGLGILGLVVVPATIVEPLIAASIVYVGIENVLSKGLTPWRPVIVFGFGLLHGLGFASVLAEVGLSQTNLAIGLIGFNIGVELGQLTVIALAFATFGLWFGRKPWYRARVANPMSILIALIGAWWFVERTVL